MRHFLCFSLILIGSSISIAWGQSADSSFEFKDTEIYSTRFLSAADESGRSVQSINSEQIAQLPARSIDEVLRLLGGIEIQNRGAFGSHANISMRGSTFNQVLVLLDGMRMNDPLTGHFNLNIGLSLAEIERIEILKGPATLIYGPDAMGGVIHIISKNYANPEKQTSTAEVLVGDHHLTGFQAGTQQHFEQTQTSISGGIMHHSSPGQTLNTGMDSYFDLWQASVGLRQKINEKWQIMGRFGLDRRDMNAAHFYTTSLADSATAQTQNRYGHLKALRKGEKSQTEVDFFSRSSQDAYDFNSLVPINEHESQRQLFQVLHQIQLQERLQVSLGGQMGRRAVESNDRGTHSDAHAGVFLLSNYRFTFPLSINAGLRYDHDENFGQEWSPQLGMSYVWKEKVIFRAMTGRSIRGADFTERFIANARTELAAERNLGNPNLNAENSWGFEIGADAYLTPKSALQLTLFQKNHSDLIDWHFTPSSQIHTPIQLAENAFYFYSQNIANLQIRGLELNGKWQLDLNPLQLVFRVDYTWIHLPEEEEASKYVANSARHLVQSNLFAQRKQWQVHLSHLFKVREAEEAPEAAFFMNDNYQLFNAKLSYQIRPSSATSLFVQVNNILDETYFDILGAQMPNRWVLGGIQVAL